MKNKMATYYEFCLDDYAAPSCTSGNKFYYGTKEMFQKLLDNLDDGISIAEAEVFREFCNGNTKVENVAGFCKVRFAKRIKVLKEKKIDTYEKETYRYENPYGFYYDIRMDFTVNLVYLIKSGNKYVIAHYSLLKNPQFKNEFSDSGWSNIDMLMGFPAMIRIGGEKDDYYLENNLLMVEKVFDNQSDAEQYFDVMEKIDYKRFLQDVFGDG